jgi:AcrR family transcriptional regulator
MERAGMGQKEQAEDTRRSLLSAAAEVFAEKGFVSATISSISRKAGLSNGSLHFHFENKAGLGRAVEAEFADTVARILREADERPGSALQRLVDAANALMRSIGDNVMVRAGFQMAGAASAAWHLDRRGPWRAWIEGVLQAAQRDGMLAEDVSPTQASAAIVATTVGLALLGLRDPQWVSSEVLRDYWELMLPRLAPPDLLAELAPQGTDRSDPAPGGESAGRSEPATS